MVQTQFTQWHGEAACHLEDETGARAVVVPDIGANCIAFSTPLRDRRAHLLSTPPDAKTLRERPTFWGYPILSPYPGRHTTPFVWGDQQYEVETVERPGVMLHGFAARVPWLVIDAGPDHLTCALDSETMPQRASAWPFRFRLTATHRLTGGQLHLILQVTNLDDCVVPHLIGLHPYFPLRFVGAAPGDPRALPTAAELVGTNPDQARATCAPWVRADDWWEMAAGLGTGRVESVRGPAGSHANLNTPRTVADLESSLGWAPPASTAEGGSASLPRLPVLLYGDRRALALAANGQTSWSPGGITSGIDDLASGARLTLETSLGFGANALFCPPGQPFISLEPRSAVSNALGLASSHRTLATGIADLAPGETWRAWSVLGVTTL